jgi:hypothetical protein
MNKYDFEQLTQSARSANLADYFLQSGYTTERYGAEVYVKEFPSLCVNQRTNKWYYHYEKIGGSNAVDCLVNVCGHDFKQAVYELTGRDINSKSSKSYPSEYRPQFTTPPKPAPEPKQEKQLQMPPSSANMRRVFAYFCKERKIPHEIVEELAHRKLLYQSAEKIATVVDGVPQIAQPPNAVFVHRNNNGEEIGGEVQGVTSFKRYKGVVEGTGDSVFMFTPCPADDNKIKTAYLFESAIDLMSFYAFCKEEKLQGVTLISMAGLKPTVPKQLREQGVTVISCVDNDDEGRKFETKHNFKRPENCLLEKANVKDWSDLLKLKINNPELAESLDVQIPEIENKNLAVRRKP